MKLTLDTAVLVNAINWAARNFDNKDDNAHIALVLNDNDGYLAHENSTSYMRAPLTGFTLTLAEGETAPVKLALSGQYLQKLGTVLAKSSGMITLERKLANSKSPLKLSGSAGRFTLPVFDSKIPDAREVQVIGSTDEFLLFDSLQRLAKICDTKNGAAIPLLESITVNFDVEEEVITLMSTDRYSMGEVIIPFEPNKQSIEFFEANENIFIPFQFSTMIPVSKDSDNVRLITETKSKKFGYAFTDGRIALYSLNLIDQPWAYQGQKDKILEEVEGSFAVPVRELRNAIGSITALAWDEGDVFFNLTENGLSVTDEHESNKVNVPVMGLELPVDDEGTVKELRMRFVRHVINQSFSPISSTNAFIGLKTAESPIYLRNTDLENDPTEDTFVITIPSVHR